MKRLLAPLVLALLLAGCAAFQTRDPVTNQPTGQLDPAKVQAAQVAAVAGGSIFGPVGGAVGTGLAGVIAAVAAAYAAKKKGEEHGYNQGSLDAGKPLASAGAPQNTGPQNMKP